MTVKVLREHRPPPNTSIIELWQFFPDPDSDPDRQFVTKIEFVGPLAMPYTSKKFRQNPFTTFLVIRRTDRRTNKPVGDWISTPSPNFVAMVTRVGPKTFCMVPLNRPSPKTPW